MLTSARAVGLLVSFQGRSPAGRRPHAAAVVRLPSGADWRGLHQLHPWPRWQRSHPPFGHALARMVRAQEAPFQHSRRLQAETTNSRDLGRYSYRNFCFLEQSRNRRIIDLLYHMCSLLQHIISYWCIACHLRALHTGCVSPSRVLA